MAIAMAALFGTIIALPLILQQVMHAEPLYVGLLLLPGALLTGLLGPVVGRLYDRVGPRWLVVPGSLAVAVGFVLFAQVAVTTPWWQLLIAHLCLSLGLAFMFTPLFTISLGALPPHLYGHGSAMVGTVQQVAGAAGTAHVRHGDVDRRRGAAGRDEPLRSPSPPAPARPSWPSG